MTPATVYVLTEETNGHHGDGPDNCVVGIYATETAAIRAQRAETIKRCIAGVAVHAVAVVRVETYAAVPEGWPADDAVLAMRPRPRKRDDVHVWEVYCYVGDIERLERLLDEADDVRTYDDAESDEWDFDYQVEAHEVRP
jgi:hypothetical protein